MNFSDKQKLKEFFDIKPTIKEMLKGLPKWKRKVKAIEKGKSH